MTTTILWHNRQLATTEHCVFREDRDGVSIEGQVVQALNGEPVRIAYQIHLDRHWLTRQVTLLRETHDTTHHLTLVADGHGSWHQDGQPLPQMQGCLDVDLGITPATNTLPIRRLGLLPGREAEVDAVWLHFPELSLHRLAQRYTCVGMHEYRYASFADPAAPFQTVLHVDDDGIVRSYEDAWQTIAYAHS